MSDTFDVVIVGGGINGCSIAYQLTKRGYKTAVLERGRVGEQASSAAAGMLGAQVEIEKKGVFFDFARESRDMFPILVPELEEASGISVSYVENGMLKTASSPEEKAHLLEIMEFQKETGERVEWWDREKLHRNEPGVSKQAEGALYIPADGQVKAKELTMAFARGASNQGAKIYEYTDVLKVLERNGKVEGVESSAGKFYAQHVVIASGAWSDRILGSDQLEMVPVKGEILSVRPREPVITRTLHASDFYIVPKLGGSVIIGATEMEGTMDKKVSAGGIQKLLNKAVALVPDLAEAEFENAWTGVRPQTIDGKPYLGAGQLNGLWTAAGHYRNGILLSALTGKWLADLIDGEPVNPAWQKEFSPLRLLSREGDLIEVSN